MENYKIEEYKEIRNEIRAREFAIAVFFQIALISSVTILSGVCAFFFNLKPNDSQNVYVYTYAFLSPIVIMLPIFYLIISHRQDMHRSGTYLQVFFEDKKNGPLWETRLTKFREKQKNESLNFLPWIFWAIYVISSGLFITALISIPNFNMLNILLLLLFAIFIGIAHYRYASFKMRQDYYIAWKKIQDAEENIK